MVVTGNAHFSTGLEWLGTRIAFKTGFKPALDGLMASDFWFGFPSPRFATFRDVEAAIHYEHSECERNAIVSWADPELQVCFNWEAYASERFLNELVFLVCERVNQARGRFCVHAASIQKSGMALVLVGDSLSGKTSLATELALRYAYQMISADLTIIGLDHYGVPSVMAGANRFVRFRADSLERSNPVLFSRLFSEADRRRNAKRSAVPSEIGLETCSGLQEIKAVILPRLESGLEPELRVLGLSEAQKLYDHLGKWLRGCEMVMITSDGRIGSVPPPYLDTPGLHLKRAEFLNSLLDRHLCFTLHGHLDGSIEVLNGLMKS